MHRQKLFNRLDLDDDRFFHQKIQPMNANWALTVVYLDNFLPLESNTASGQFNTQSLFVNFFNESWPQAFMNLECCIEYIFTYTFNGLGNGLKTWFSPRLLRHLYFPLCLCVLVP